MQTLLLFIRFMAMLIGGVFCFAAIVRGLTVKREALPRNLRFIFWALFVGCTIIMLAKSSRLWSIVVVVATMIWLIRQSRPKRPSRRPPLFLNELNRK